MQSNLTWMAAEVAALRDLTPTVREFLIRPREGDVVPHTPGAHLQVEVQGASGQWQTRSYSLVGEPDDQGWRIAVKRLDDGRGGSRAMWRLQVGDALRVGTPQNHFGLDLAAPGYLLVAGGIGVTPLVGMAQRLAAVAARRGVPLAMLYGARHADEFAYRDLLQAALGDRLSLCEGRAAMDLAAAIAALPGGGQLYACGPAPMLAALQRAWQDAGRPPADLRFETFGSGGRLGAQPFRVRVPRHGLEIEVPTDRSLLDCLEAAGVQVLSDCQRGECGLCAMEVLAVDGEIDHRDVFLSAEEKRDGRRLCACVSRAVGTLTLDSAWRAGS